MSKLKIILLLVFVSILAVVLLVGYGFFRLRNMKDTNDLESKVDKMGSAFINDGKGVGLAVGIVKGDQIFIGTYGLADVQTQKAIEQSTIFEIGSITKAFTAEMVQLNVEKGLLDWNTPFDKYFPQDNKPKNTDGTTLLHLVTHTSGFPRVPEKLLELMTDECNPYQSIGKSAYFAYLQNPTDKQKPDIQNSDYSNVGVGILGDVLEYSTGKSYEELLQKEICEVLGLRHTSLNVQDSSQFATGYDELKKKTCHWDLPVMFAAGAIRSNIVDMTHFAKAQVSENPLFKSFQATHQQVYPTTMGGIGKVWNIDSQTSSIIGTEPIVWHNGGTGGFSSYLGFLPDSKVAVVLLSNQSNNESLDRLGIKLLTTVSKISFSQKEK